MIRKRLKGKKKKNYWPSKLTPGGQFHRNPWNTGFHRITLGQSDSAPTGAPSIHWMPEHQFPSDHIRPEWFSTHRRTIHPLDAWTCCGWTWTSPVPSPPVLAHRHRLTDKWIYIYMMMMWNSIWVHSTINSLKAYKWMWLHDPKPVTLWNGPWTNQLSSNGITAHGTRTINMCSTIHWPRSAVINKVGQIFPGSCKLWMETRGMQGARDEWRDCGGQESVTP